MDAPALDSIRTLTVPEVCDALGKITPKTLWNMRRRGAFPKPVEISPGRIGFFASEISAYLEERRKRY